MTETDQQIKCPGHKAQQMGEGEWERVSERGGFCWITTWIFLWGFKVPQSLNIDLLSSSQLNTVFYTIKRLKRLPAWRDRLFTNKIRKKYAIKFCVISIMGQQKPFNLPCVQIKGIHVRANLSFVSLGDFSTYSVSGYITPVILHFHFKNISLNVRVNRCYQREVIEHPNCVIYLLKAHVSVILTQSHTQSIVKV